MAENKVLIIAYYWPPSGGSGVQRWLKFVKYLPQYGWLPYVFTPENPAFAVRDESLLKDIPPEAEVIHFPIWEPYEAFLKLSGVMGGKAKAVSPTEMVSAKNKKNSLFQRLSTWVRGNLFIPDPRRFWVKPSVAFLEDFIRENGIKNIITTGPPHSMHLIGLRLKKKIPSINWLADFRDPWSQWGLLDSLRAGAFARSRHKRLEKKVLSTADTVTTITPFYVRQFQSLGQRPVALLTNGYDEDDFKGIVHRRPEKFLIRHIGIVNEKCDPRSFLLVLKEMIMEDDDFAHNVKLEFIGEVHPQIRAFIQDDKNLSAAAIFTGNLPHKQLITLYGESSLLLLVLHGYKDAEGYMPGKLFEYLATGLPVLGVGPVRGDAGQLLNETGSGRMIAADDKNGMKDFIRKHFEQWKQGEQVIHRATVSAYSRRERTRALTELLER